MHVIAAGGRSLTALRHQCQGLMLLLSPQVGCAPGAVGLIPGVLPCFLRYLTYILSWA